jgi:hypothetical protein
LLILYLGAAVPETTAIGQRPISSGRTSPLPSRADQAAIQAPFPARRKRAFIHIPRTEASGKCGAFQYSSNPIERLNGEIKRGTQIFGIFPSVAAITRLIEISRTSDIRLPPALFSKVDHPSNRDAEE